MRNDGKPLEKTIQLIEETFKDSAHTEVFRNHKLKSKAGDEREIDVFIKTISSGYEMGIAIECKDYNAKISVEKMDAFNSKCNIIPEVNRKIFISKKGFQKGAISHAKLYDIELMTAEELDIESLNSLPPIHNLATDISPAYGNRIITLDGNYDHLYINDEFTFRGIILNTINSQKINIDSLFAIKLRENQNQIQQLALIQWMQMDSIEKSKLEKVIIVKLELLFENYAVENSKSERIPILKGSCDVEIVFKKLNPVKVSSRLIKYSDESLKAQSIKIKLDDNTESEMIIRPNDEFDFYSSVKNTIVKFDKLGIYDTETKVFKKK